MAAVATGTARVQRRQKLLERFQGYGLRQVVIEASLVGLLPIRITAIAGKGDQS